MSEHTNERKKPVDYDELFPGRFVKAGLFKARPGTLTIAAVDVEPLPQDDGTERMRGVISFRGTPKQWVLNSTNGQCLRAMFGKHLPDWIGKRVTLACEQDRFGRETVDAIRVQGSPDIAAAIEIEIKLPRRKPRTRHLERTTVGGKRSDPGTTAAQQPAEPPADAGDAWETEDKETGI